MKQLKKIVWGVILIAAGSLFVLNALNITNINLFFDGWWTLFIIVPCTAGLITERDKTGNLIGVIIGVFLLLCCRDILSFSLFWKLIIPVAIIIIGLKMIFSGIFGNKANEIFSKMKNSGTRPVTGCAAFSGCDLNFNNQIFEGAELTAAFGGVECDLRNAIINQDCAIRVHSVFGGIDILVPDGINVKTNTISIFGGVSNKTQSNKNAPTIYISGICMFGGVDIK